MGPPWKKEEIRLWVNKTIYKKLSNFLKFQEETEWQHYLRACIEIIIKVSDLLPDDVLQIVVSYNSSIHSSVGTGTFVFKKLQQLEVAPFWNPLERVFIA